MFKGLGPFIFRLPLAAYLGACCMISSNYSPPGNPDITVRVLKNQHPQNAIAYSTSSKYSTRYKMTLAETILFAPDMKRLVKFTEAANHQFSLLKSNGQVIRNYDISNFQSFIQNVRVGNSYFEVYDEGAASGYWTPGGFGSDENNFPNADTFFYVFSTETGKQVYKASVLHDGMPIAITGRWLWTVKITNPFNFYMNGYKPHIAFDIRRTANGALVAAIPIPYSFERDYDPQLDSVHFSRHPTDPRKYSVMAYNNEDSRGWDLITFKVHITNRQLEIIFGATDPYDFPYRSTPKKESNCYKVTWRFPWK